VINSRGRTVVSASAKSLALFRALLLCLLASPVSVLAENRLVIISPHNEAIRTEFARGFSDWLVKQFAEPATIDWREVGGTADCVRFVQSEFATKPDGIGIDCFFGGGHEPYLVLADQKLSLRYTPPPEILSGIPQNINGVEIYDSGHTWYGVALSSFGILENRRVQRQIGLPMIHRWEELTQRQLFGWIGAGDPRNSGTMNVMFESFLQAYGWERGWQILTQISGNVRQFDRISSSTAKDVTLGETAYAFAVDFFAFAQIAAAGRTNLTFVLPHDFTAVSADGLAILRGAPNLVTAQHFVDFALSEAGQKLWFLPRGHPEGPRQYSIERMSVRPDFYPRYRGISNIEFSPFELKQNFRYNGKLARERRELVAALVGALFVDTHSELKAAWQAVIRRRLQPADLNELGRMPLTETEALELARKAWNNAAVRNQKKIDWQVWAQRKYLKLVEQPSPSPLPSPPGRGGSFRALAEDSTASDFFQRGQRRFPLLGERVRVRADLLLD